MTPNLNEAAYLPVFLESLTRQSFQNFELIVVDGCSSDGSLEILRRYAARMRLKIFEDPTRNIGYIRNVGCRCAQGDVLFHASSDTYFPPDLLEKVAQYYEDPGVISVAGRVYPIKSGTFSVVAYSAWEIMRFIFSRVPFPVRKYRPAGTFCSMRNSVFRAVDGFPHVKINEDGLLGQRIDDYVKEFGGRCVYDLHLLVGHYAKRFKMKGGVKTLAFYIYILANMLPFLRPFMKNLEYQAGELFASRADFKAVEK